jgi:hypothetical protein
MLPGPGRGAAAAGHDTARRRGRHLDKRTALDLAEASLAALLENERYRGLAPLLDVVVEVDKGHAQLGSQRSSERGLATTHVSDKKYCSHPVFSLAGSKCKQKIVTL